MYCHKTSKADPLAPGSYQLSIFSIDTIYVAIGNFIAVIVFLFSVFFIVSQVTVTVTTPCVTVVCPAVSSIPITVTVVPTSVCLAAASGQHDVVCQHH